MLALRNGRSSYTDARELEVAPNLWSGVGLVRGGAGTALVGSHQEVADRLAEYHRLGIDEFILSGYPHVEEAYWFGEGVMPLLRQKGIYGDAGDRAEGRGRTRLIGTEVSRRSLAQPPQPARDRWLRKARSACLETIIRPSWGVWDAWGVDDVTWGALTLTLTLLGGLWTFYAFRSRGVASGLRGAGLTLLPAAAWMTGTLEMFTDIGGAVGDWATHLVFSPIVWAGIVLAGISVLLFGASSALRERGRGGKPGAAAAPAEPAKREQEGAPEGLRARALPRSTTTWPTSRPSCASAASPDGAPRPGPRRTLVAVEPGCRRTARAARRRR